MNARTQTKPEASPEQLAAIEATWLVRAKLQNLPHPTSPVYRAKEAEFFIGAMSTLEALGYSVRPAWAIQIMSGRNVVQQQ